MDGGGIDPSLDLYDSTGDRIYNSHYGNQSQVTGPQNNVPIDFNITVNPCGNFSNSFTLGTFPSDQETFVVTADTYEKSSNFLNDQCSSYNALFDRNYASGTHTFDFTQPAGLIDVGGCMTYNYVFEMTLAGTLSLDYLGPICSSDTIFVGSKAYHKDNPSETFTVQGLPNTCDTIFNVDLTFHDEISFMLNGPSTICPGQNEQLVLSESFQDYMWSDGSTLPVLTINGEGSYSVTVTTANGCTKEAAIIVDEFARPNVSIQGEDSICTGSTATLYANSNGNSIVWSTGETTDSIDISEAGFYNVLLTDNNGCTGADVLIVSEIPQPDLNLTGSQFFCLGDSTTIEVDQNFSSYAWSDFSDMPTLTIKEAGNYSLTVTDQDGCTAEQLFTIDAYNSPTPTLSGSTTICMGTPIIITIDETYETYLWDNGETTQEITASVEGSYTVTVTDTNGCTASSSRQISETAQLNPTITGDLKICEGETTTLIVMEDQVSYLWEDGSTNQNLNVTASGNYGLTITDTNGCSGTALTTVEVIPQIITELDSLTCYQDQVGTEEIEIENSEGCTDIIRYNIEYDILGECSIGYFISGRSETCPGANDAIINIEVLGGVYPVTIELLDEDENLVKLVELQSEENPVILGGLARGIYTVFVTGDNGEFKTATLDRDRSGEFPILYDELVTINAGENVLLSAEIDTTLLDTYFWVLDGEPLCSQNCTSFSVTPEESTTYQFIATHDTLACVIEVKTEVIVIPAQDLYIPTIFSIAENDTNGEFTISGPGLSSISDISIFDRWGNIIFQQDGASPPWDGRSNGKEAEEGVYIYIIELNSILPEGGTKTSYQTGTITLIK